MPYLELLKSNLYSQNTKLHELTLSNNVNDIKNLPF